jgi:tricorn protease
VGVDAREVAVSPDGKTLAMIALSGERPNVYVYPLDPLIEKPVARQLTSTGDERSSLHFIGDRLYFRAEGRVMSVPLHGDMADGPHSGQPEGAGEIGIAAPGEPSSPASRGPADGPRESPLALEMDIDFQQDKKVIFDQAWRYLDENFHDPKFNGADWQAIRQTWLPRVMSASTPVELRRLLSLMVGELNASHLGVGAPVDPSAPATGQLGVEFDPVEYDRTGQLKISRIVPFGPADLVKLKPGDLLADVDGQSTDRPANLDQLLDGKADREVVLTIEDGADKKEVRIMTASNANMRTLLYRDWVESNRRYVAAASGGKLGYVHLEDMLKPTLARLASDLDQRNQNYIGIVVDARNNAGGFVNGYAIDVFSRKNYITMLARGNPAVTGRTQLGQRFLGLPTILVTNRETLSDGEDFTEGYRSLQLGKVVGEPTAGWIIFTEGTTLLDGTRFRLPAVTINDNNGIPLEMHPRPVDVAVDKPFGQSLSGRDAQLDTAVAELLKQLDAKEKSSP